MLLYDERINSIHAFIQSICTWKLNAEKACLSLKQWSSGRFSVGIEWTEFSSVTEISLDTVYPK